MTPSWYACCHVSGHMCASCRSVHHDLLPTWHPVVLRGLQLDELSPGHNDGTCCMSMASLGFAGMLRREKDMLVKTLDATLETSLARLWDVLAAALGRPGDA